MRSKKADEESSCRARRFGDDKFGDAFGEDTFERAALILTPVTLTQTSKCKAHPLAGVAQGKWRHVEL